MKCAVRNLMICLICAGLLMVVLPQPVLGQQAEWKLYKTYFWSFVVNPYGKLAHYVDIYKLVNDGNTGYDWYMIKSRLQTVPGILVYASDWRTDYTWNYHYIRQYYSYQYLLGYAPTTAPGAHTSGWTWNLGGAFGWSGSGPVAIVTGGFGAVHTWTSSDAMVKDQSDFDSHQARWWWDIYEGANVGLYTFLSEGAYVLMTYEGYSIKVGLYWGARWTVWGTPKYTFPWSTYITYP